MSFEGTQAPKELLQDAELQHRMCQLSWLLRARMRLAAYVPDYLSGVLMLYVVLVYPLLISNQ